MKLSRILLLAMCILAAWFPAPLASACVAFTTLAYFTYFNGLHDGSEPHGALIQASDGNFYGTTKFGGNTNASNLNGLGTVFKITTNGTFKTLYEFSGPDGKAPEGALVQGKEGSFYGTTSYGGLNYHETEIGIDALGYGTVFRITIPPVFNSVNLINGEVSFNWNILPGQRYQLQYNTNLSSTNWLNLGSAITASNTLVSATDAATNAQSFYRIMLLQ